MSDDSYADAVQLLRDVTMNVEAADNAMGVNTEIAGLGGSTADEPPLEDVFREIGNIAAQQRKMENVALAALAMELDTQTAIEAIEEAGAGWVYEALLRRAAESAENDRAMTAVNRRYLWLATQFLRLLDQGLSVPLAEAQQLMVDGSFLTDLLEKYHGEPHWFDISRLDAADREAVSRRLQVLASGGVDGIDLGVTRDGLMLAVAYCLEVLQGHAIGGES